MRARPAVLAFLLAVGCRSLPPGAEVRRAIAEGRVEGRAIEGVPFVEQPSRGCGPAALASVLGFHGAEVSPKEIREQEIVPSRLGTYTYELALFARRRGLFARDLRFPCEAEVSPMRRLLALLDEGLPVVVLVRRGTPPFTNFHYVAVTGYDDTTGLVLFQDGKTKDGVERYLSFQDDWHAGDHWALVVAPPERDFTFLTAEDRLELASLCEERGSWAEASAHYAKVLEERPEDREALVGRAGALSHLGRVEEAGALFERTVAETPEDPRALNNFALHLLRSGGDLERAESIARRALALAPALSAYVEDTIGQILAARGDTAGARVAFESALAGARPGEERLRREIREHLGTLQARGGASR